MSCFACHLKKNSENPLCFWRDDLKEVLQMCLDSDAIVIGTPRGSKIKKEIKTAMIYTMNVTKEMDYFNGEDQLAIMRGYLTAIFGECEALYAYDTKQFKKYDPYLNNMFDPELKEKSKEVQFPKDCAKAFDLGKRLSDE